MNKSLKSPSQKRVLKLAGQLNKKFYYEKVNDNLTRVIVTSFIPKKDEDKHNNSLQPATESPKNS